MAHRIAHLLTSYWMPAVMFMLSLYIVRQCAIATGRYVPQKTYHYVRLSK